MRIECPCGLTWDVTFNEEEEVISAQGTRRPMASEKEYDPMSFIE